MDPDLAAATALLDQAAELIWKIDPTSWTQPNPHFRDSTLGQHFRHTLDHYSSLLTHTPDHTIDYDSRHRDPTLEASPDAARAKCQELLHKLETLGKNLPPDQPFFVQTSCSLEGEITSRNSSFGRELQFLVSHTVHHFAIIGAICHRMDIELPPTFGIAPSTLKHRKALANG